MKKKYVIIKNYNHKLMNSYFEECQKLDKVNIMIMARRRYCDFIWHADSLSKSSFNKLSENAFFHKTKYSEIYSKNIGVKSSIFELTESSLVITNIEIFNAIEIANELFDYVQGVLNK